MSGDVPVRFCERLGVKLPRATHLIVMNLQSGTQSDALSHVWYDHKLYNGYPASAITGLGATKNGIEKVAERGQVVTRGVLLDVARKNGLKHLAPNTIVTPRNSTRRPRRRTSRSNRAMWCWYVPAGGDASSRPATARHS